MPENKNGKLEIVSSKVQYNDIYDLAKSITPAECIVPSCKLCVSPLRQEAEAEYAKLGASASNSGAVSAVFRFLKNKDEDISYNAVRNHLYYHTDRKEKEERFKEYMQEMERWRAIRPPKDGRLEDFVDILYQQIHTLRAFSPENDLNEKRKTAETVVKLIASVNECQDRLDKSKEYTDVIHTFIERFSEVVKLYIQNTKDAKIKETLSQALASLLGEAGKIVGDLNVN